MITKSLFIRLKERLGKSINISRKLAGGIYIYDEQGLRKNAGLTTSEKSNSSRARLGRTTRKKNLDGTASLGVQRRDASFATRAEYGWDYEHVGAPDPDLYRENEEEWIKQAIEYEAKVEQKKAKMWNEKGQKIMQAQWRQEKKDSAEKTIKKAQEDISKKRETEQKLDKMRALTAKGVSMYNKRVQQEKKREKIANTIKNSQMYKKTHSR